MKSLQKYLNSWSGPSAPPKISDRDWGIASLLGVVLAVMAVLQIINFGGFKDALSMIGLTSSPALWAVLIIIAELWGALGFFKIKLNNLGRTLSGAFAVVASGFWFIETLKLISEGADAQLRNSGFFGKYLQQTPGWWTVIEVTLFLFLVLYTVDLMNSKRK